VRWTELLCSERPETPGPCSRHLRIEFRMVRGVNVPRVTSLFRQREVLQLFIPVEHDDDVVGAAIQELAGHQYLSTTQRYMHLSPAAKARFGCWNTRDPAEILETSWRRPRTKSLSLGRCEN